MRFISGLKGLKSKGKRHVGRPWAMWFRQTVESEREERQKSLEIVGPSHLTSDVPNIRRYTYCETSCSEGTGLVLVLLANCVNLHCLFSKLWIVTFKKQIPTAQKTQHLHCNDQLVMLYTKIKMPVNCWTHMERINRQCRQNGAFLGVEADGT
jgi:hypothetical protein